MRLQLEVADATMQTDAQPPPPDTHAVTDRQVRVEQRLSDLRIEQLRTSIVEEEQRAHRAREEELSRVLQAERDVIASLRNELDMLRKAEAERSAELSSALEGLLAAQKQLAARESDCSHWRTEAARAVGRLDTLAGHCEAQRAHTRPRGADRRPGASTRCGAARILYSTTHRMRRRRGFLSHLRALGSSRVPWIARGRSPTGPPAVRSNKSAACTLVNTNTKLRTRHAIAGLYITGS